MKQFIQKNIAYSGLGLALLLLVIVGGASYRSITRLLVTDKWVKHTYTVLEEIDDVRSALKDAEQGRRDYILTKDETYLETFELGEQTVERKLKTLRYLRADNPRQQQHLDNLQPLVEKQLDSLRNSITLPQQNRSNFNIQVTLSQKDIGLQAQIRKILDEMDAQERELLQGWSLASEVSVRNTIALFVGGYTFSFALLLGVFSLLEQRIRDRQKAEQAQQESDRRFHAIFHQTFQFIGLLTPEGIVLEINQTALDFAGLQTEDIIGHLFWEEPWWTNTEDREGVKTAIEQAAAGDFVRYEVDVRGAGDRVVTIDFSLKPVKDESDRVVLLIPEGRDITERQQAEQALRESE